MVLDGWRDTSTRIALLILALVLLTNSGAELWWCGEGEGPAREGGKEGGGKERKQVLATITGHCLPKLVCQLHSLESTEHISDSERNLISLVGSGSLTAGPSKYRFAAHMGQLVRGLEGTGCHNFFPDCPFSNQDVLQIARRINFK